MYLKSPSFPSSDKGILFIPVQPFKTTPSLSFCFISLIKIADPKKLSERAPGCQIVKDSLYLAGMQQRTTKVLFTSKHPNSMARKSKRSDLANSKSPATPVTKPDTGRQPRIVGWLVLIVGGFSSWYWYRPLPDTVNQTVHSTTPSSWAATNSGPKSLWSDSGLVVPSTSGITVNQLEVRVDASNQQRVTAVSTGNQQSDESQLIGPPKVTLVPWNEVQHDIRDVLKTERVPLVPIAPNLIEGNSLFNSPRVWTSEKQHPNRAGDTAQSNANWPDEGYDPPEKAKRNQQRTAAQITTQIPPLLETGMKSIRTTDSDDSARTNDISKSTSPGSAVDTPPEPTRQPQFIRQPRKNN